MGLARDSIEAVAERLEEVDGGLLCPDCEAAVPTLEHCLPEALLRGECPVHGRFYVQVSKEYQEELGERIDDLPYQRPHDLL